MALHALVAQALADPQQDFQAWLAEAAQAEGLRIFRWGAIDLDQDGSADETVAWLCDPRASRGTEPRGSAPFSVLFVDADAPRDAPTHIATSEPQRGEPLSYGMLARQPGLSALPPVASAMRDDYPFHTIRRLEPGQPLRPPE